MKKAAYYYYYDGHTYKTARDLRRSFSFYISEGTLQSLASGKYEGGKYDYLVGQITRSQRPSFECCKCKESVYEGQKYVIDELTHQKYCSVECLAKSYTNFETFTYEVD